MKRLPTSLRRFFASPRRRYTVRPRLERLESRVAPTVNLLNNFDGLVSGAPPDTNGAAGPNSYIETVNSTVAIYNKFTNASITSDLITHFLYTTGGLAQADANAAPSDVTMCYDEPIGRFIVGTLDVDRGGTSGNAQAPSQFDFAVSKSFNPTALDKANWNFYSFSTTEGTLWSDYPGNIGYNADALVVTFNMFGSNGGSFQHVQVNAFSQSSLADASNVTDTYFDGSSGSSWRPVTMHDATPGGPMWFVSSATNGGNTITLERVDNILNTSSTLHTFNISVNSYNALNAALNPNGTSVVSGTNGQTDARIQKAAERNNLIVASHAVGVNKNEDDARWYEFNVSNINAPYLVQQGNVSYGANTYVVYPAIDINPLGDIGMDFTKVGNDTTTDYMSAYITGWKSSDSSGTMEAPVEIKAGDSNNTDGRMGDFSGINVDPIDGTFWAAAEYTESSSGATEVANFALNANFTVNNSQLQVVGDQSGVNYNDNIAIDVNPSGSLYAVLNGEANIYGAGQITSIIVDPRGGYNTVQINNVPTICPTTVTGDGANYVTVGNSSDGVQGIDSGVDVYNGYPTPSSTGYTSLTIDDSTDIFGRNATLYDLPYGVGSYQVGSLEGLAPSPINWFDNSSGTYTGGVSYLAIYGGSGGNTFTVTNTGALVGGTYLNSGKGTNTVNVEGTTGSLVVDGGIGVQNVYVGSNGSALGGTLANILGVVDVDNSLLYGIPNIGYSFLYVDDSGSQSSPAMNLDLDFLSSSDMPSYIQWEGYRHGVGGVFTLHVYGGSGGFNTFAVNSTGSGSTSYDTYLYTGTGARNSVNVYSTWGSLTIITQGPQDGISVGSDGNNSDSTMANINGLVEVEGPGAASLGLTDFGDTTGRTVNIYDGEVSGLAPANIYWSDYNPNGGSGGVYSMEVDGGSGGNAFDVRNTSPFTTFLQTGSGNDQVNVYATTGTLYSYNPGGFDGVDVGVGNMTAINGLVDVYGPGSTALLLDDSSDTTGRTAYLYDGRVTGLSPAPIEYTPTSSASGGVYVLGVIGGSGGNTFYVENTSNLYYYTLLNTGTGNDSVYVYNTQSALYLDNTGGSDSINVGAGNMSGINGLVTVEGAGSTALLVDDSSDSTSRTVTMGPGAFNKGFVVTGMGNAAPVAYDLGVTSVTPTVDGGSGNNTWDITKTGAGIATTVNGGNGNDTFNLGSGNGPNALQGALTLNGGGGSNTLNYGSYDGNVVVDLQIGTATGVSGGVANIQNVTGNSAGAAGSFYNILVGNGGNVLTGGSDQLNLLIAGGSASTLMGGSANDILAAGTTDYDSNLAALLDIMSVWMSAGSFANRVARLVDDPTYAHSLNAGTVHSNGGGNMLQGKLPLGSNAPDLYFADLGAGDSIDAVAGDRVVAIGRVNVSSDVSVTRSGLNYNFALHEFVQTLTITNTSGSALLGPLALELTGLSSNATLANASGTYNGNPYIDFLSVGQSLAAGQSITVTLYFQDPTFKLITYGAQVWQNLT